MEILEWDESGIMATHDSSMLYFHRVSQKMIATKMVAPILINHGLINHGLPSATKNSWVMSCWVLGWFTISFATFFVERVCNMNIERVNETDHPGPGNIYAVEVATAHPSSYQSRGLIIMFSRREIDGTFLRPEQEQRHPEA